MMVLSTKLPTDDEKAGGSGARVKLNSKQSMESPAPVEEIPMAEAPNKPRPIITKMVLENFKSYAGVKEIGPFHKVKKYAWGVHDSVVVIPAA